MQQRVQRYLGNHPYRSKPIIHHFSLGRKEHGIRNKRDRNRKRQRKKEIEKIITKNPPKSTFKDLQNPATTAPSNSYSSIPLFTSFSLRPCCAKLPQ
jgi:hypothetical protein